MTYRFCDSSFNELFQRLGADLISNSGTEIKLSAKQGGHALVCAGLRRKNNINSFGSFVPIDNVYIRDNFDTKIKNTTFDTTLLKLITTYEYNVGNLYLNGNIVAFPFDDDVDNVIYSGKHGSVQVMGDEWYLGFTIPDLTQINSTFVYEVVFWIFTPKLLKVNQSEKTIDVQF